MAIKRRIQAATPKTIEVAPGVHVSQGRYDEDIVEDLKDGRMVSKKIQYQGQDYYIDMDTEKLVKSARGRSGHVKKASPALCREVGKDVWYDLYPDDSYD